MVDPSVSVLANAQAHIDSVNWASLWHADVDAFMPHGLKTGESMFVKACAYAPNAISGTNVGRALLVEMLSEIEAYLSNVGNQAAPQRIHARNAMIYLRGMVASILVAHGDARDGVTKLVNDLGPDRVAIGMSLLNIPRINWTRPIVWRKDGGNVQFNVPAAITENNNCIVWAAKPWKQ